MDTPLRLFELKIQIQYEVRTGASRLLTIIVLESA